MRLINTTTRAFEEFLGGNIPQYAILSHTWEEEEVSCADYLDGKHLTSHLKGYAKIDKTCEIAAEEGIQYAWIDTCCIDKRSSAELTEAINSMFRWYERAEVCYAYLSDLFPRTRRKDPVNTMHNCRWFTRGWTLQELIAPDNMYFFNSMWDCIGSKESLSAELSDITGIQDSILSNRDSLASIPVATRMSWASRRVTTRVEDSAYCLLGLFDVNMPLLYGEEEKAFQRLQAEIIKNIPDLSILAWESPLPYQSHEPESRIYCGVLAGSPSYFAWCRKTYLRIRPPRKEFSVSNSRVVIQSTLLVCKTTRGQGSDYVLPIHYGDSERSFVDLGVALRKVGDGQFLRSDPHKLYKKTSRHYPNLPSNSITEEYLSELRPRSIWIRLGSNMRCENAYPLSRFDYKDGLFFVSDEFDDQNDWGVFEFGVQPDLSEWDLNSPWINCNLYTTSWGSRWAPQCSVISYQPYAQQIDEMRANFSQWDHDKDGVLRTLVNKKIPCVRSAIVDIPGTGMAAVVSLEIKIRDDVPSCILRGHAWDVHISCSVYKSDCVPVPRDKSRSRWDIFG